MKKIITTICLSYFLLVGSAFCQGVLITNFNEAISADSPWVWNSSNKTITTSGNNGASGQIYPDAPISVNITGNTTIRLTLANVITTSPGGGFQISLESTGGGAALASFTYAAFSSATVVEAPLTLGGGFNTASVTQWNILDGGAGGTLSPMVMAVSSIHAVPEPSTYALMALGGLVLFFIARRRKAQV